VRDPQLMCTVNYMVNWNGKYVNYMINWNVFVGVKCRHSPVIINLKIWQSYTDI